MGQEASNERKGEVAIAVLAYIFGDMGDPMKLSALKKNLKGITLELKDGDYGDITEAEIWQCWVDARTGAEKLNAPSERKRIDGFRRGENED